MQNKCVKKVLSKLCAGCKSYSEKCFSSHLNNVESYISSSNNVGDFLKYINNMNKTKSSVDHCV